MIKKSVNIIVLIFVFMLIPWDEEKGATFEANKIEMIECQVVGEQQLEEKEYELQTETYTNKNIKVEYPQIVYLKNEAKQDEMNKVIKKVALAHFLETMQSLEPGQTYEAEGTYEIKLKRNDMLSIAFKSYNNIWPSAHPFQLFYTLNIDLSKGKQLCLSDFVPKIDRDFIDLLKKAKYVGELGSEFEEQIKEQVFTQYNDEQLILALINSEEHNIYFYITENALGISIPIAHVAGDHAEFEIDWNDLKPVRK